MAGANVSNICVGNSSIESPSVEETALKLTAYSAAFVVAFFGNILAISVVLRNVHFKTTTNIFILNMAVSDLLITITCIPSTIFSIATHNRGTVEAGGILGHLICKLLPFLQGLSITVSILTVTSIACDRFLAIVYPFKNVITLPIAKALIGLIWMVSAAIISPMLYAMKFYEQGEFRYCTEEWEPAFDSRKAAVDYTVFLFVTQYAAPLLVITALYSTLIKDLWQSSRVHSDRKRAYKENTAVLKMLITIIATFAVCWLPMHVTLFVSIFSTDPVIQACGPKAVYLFLGYFLGHAHSACNPAIYFTFNENFRKEIRKMILVVKSCFVTVRRRTEDERSRHTAQTVSFDLKRVSFSSVSEKSNKTNGKCNVAVELKDEDRQGDVDSSVSTGQASLGDNDRMSQGGTPLAEADHMTIEAERRS